ncbi:glycoside hydrolase family 16 protein [Shewanella sp. JM162201]|uniref:Glycoside hydrolase family 16 protein n=1 Tax=Shewanella jiangmenensis TaxID=2837387 RepID=A0ABS5V3H6_9GAMM|nr:glycoside hydrolase family 16 protein [Shewanella jiangmenensis]MBT1444989.1 glycoside hydrolase family 16 protein [Shewanella jiangmenensis]
MKITSGTTKYVSLGLLFASLQGCGGDTNTNTDIGSVDLSAPVTGWNLVWSDEFDGSSIDAAKWTHEVNCSGGGNQESQCYTDAPENSFVADGMLNIVALKAAEGAEKPYTSARLSTKGKADFSYGRIEMRAKLPSGQGSWAAFWMLPTDNVYGIWPRSGEIDIVESVNLKVKDAEGKSEATVHGTLHYGREWPKNEYSGQSYLLPNGANPADDFHTYAIEWQEGEIRWYVDGYLFATQRRSELRYNAKGEPVGLAHKGWFTEYYDQSTGKLQLAWGNQPFDEKFHLLLNFAVGGSWPTSVNQTGIDDSAFHANNRYQVDYVRVYQCQANPDTGKGCETVRPGYDKLGDGLIEGKAPAPVPPSDGLPKDLVIFDSSVNPSWPAWDCCGGSTPSLVDDADKGQVYRFVVGDSPTVNGFISRDAFITDPAGTPSPFDASPIESTGVLSFAMKVVSAPANPGSTWMMKVESSEGATAVELPLTASSEGAAPAVGSWQTFSFPLSELAAKGLDLSAIDVVMVFPAWGTGSGAEYLLDEVKIARPNASLPSLTIFTDNENPDWPMWDCCGGSTPAVVSDDAVHGIVSEFSIGASPTVMGYINRTALGGGGNPFDASSLYENGVIQFDLKVVNAPGVANAPWLFKVESDNAATAVELPLTASVEGSAPSADWQTFTFRLKDLADGGLDLSAIDVLMMFPAWGQGEGAVYRVDNVKIYQPGSGAPSAFGLFADAVADAWSLWDCCAGSTPSVEADDAAHGAVAQYVIGAQPTVVGFFADDGVYHDASAAVDSGVVRFEMKLVSAPSDPSSVWKFKIESGDAATAVELNLTDSLEGAAPVVGAWQTYTFPLKTLTDMGLDASAIDVVMVFPAWGTGDGAVFRLDNALIGNP